MACSSFCCGSKMRFIFINCWQGKMISVLRATIFPIPPHLLYNKYYAIGAVLKTSQFHNKMYIYYTNLKPQKCPCMVPVRISTAHRFSAEVQLFTLCIVIYGLVRSLARSHLPTSTSLITYSGIPFLSFHFISFMHRLSFSFLA